MTRDEAIKIYLRSPYQKGCSEWRVAGEFIDKFVALGMLKLDDPKSAEDRAIEVFEAATSDPYCGPRQLLARLDACGLKIVEK